MNFEMAHQRVQLQGKVAEAESRAALMRETLQEKVGEGHTPAGPIYPQPRSQNYAQIFAGFYKRLRE